MPRGDDAARAGLGRMLDELGVRVTGAVPEGLATVVARGDGAASLLCAVRRDAGSWDLAAVNAANASLRFARFSVSRGHLVLAVDAPFDAAAPGAAAGLARIVGVWRLALDELRSLVRETTPA